MAATTANPFDLLQLADGDDPSSLLAAAASLHTKPPPLQQTGHEARNNDAPRRGGFGRGDAARGRGGRGPNRNYGDGEANGYTDNYNGGVRGGGGEELGAEKGGGGGGYGGPRPSRGRGWYGNGDAGGNMGRPRRAFERHSGTGRGYEVKRDGAGRGNWGTTDDDVDVIAQVKNENANSDEKVAASEAQKEQDNGLVGGDNKDKENPDNEQEDKEEDKEMTLEEYEKVLEEKRKALLSMKAEERKVEVDKDLKSMKQLSTKKGTDEVFIKLGSDKDAAKRKENEKEERAKKSVSINDFLKPTEGGRYYGQGGRGRGRGRGSSRGGYGGRAPSSRDADAPSIEDPGHFPTLGAK